MKYGKITLLAVVAALATSIVWAAVGDDAAVTRGATGRYTNSPALAESTTAQGGNVTRIDLETNTSTVKWQGFFGNVSGNLLLGLGANILYDFGAGQVVAVYAARDQAFDFANIDEATAADVDTVFGFATASHVDQAVDVFTTTLSLDTLVNTPSTTLADGNFECYIADDTNNAAVNDFAFGGQVINAGAAGFNGAIWQYELLVPIEAATPTYYFFMSI